MLHIRKVKPEDIGSIMRLAGGKAGISGRLLSNPEHFLICEVDNVKCGCGCLVPDKDRGYLCWVLVDADHRRKKLGSLIVKALLNIADNRGIKEVYSAGICGEFLEALGFEETEDPAAEEALKKLFVDIDAGKCYKVSLEGYFSSCN